MTTSPGQPRRKGGLRSMLRLAPLLGLFAALAGCGGESATIRYRATAKMVIDGELREGSAVREMTITETPNNLTGFGLKVVDRGEAIIVDIGKNRSAVYFLRNDLGGTGYRLSGTMQNCFGIESGSSGSGWTKAFEDIPIGQACVVKPEVVARTMPLIVAFRDESVPKSIFEATPKSLKDAFNVDGYFREMTFERVPDNTPLTKAIDQRLPWLNEIPFKGSSFRVLDPSGPFGARSDARLAQTVTDYYFRD